MVTNTYTYTQTLDDHENKINRSRDFVGLTLSFLCVLLAAIASGVTYGIMVRANKKREFGSFRFWLNRLSIQSG
jgi:hypothetical protein